MLDTNPGAPLREITQQETPFSTSLKIMVQTLLHLDNPTYYPVNKYNEPSTINLGLAKGIQNISISTSEDLSSDSNPICFLVGLDNITPQNFSSIDFLQLEPEDQPTRKQVSPAQLLSFLTIPTYPNSEN
ncbi:hypothetical protein NPIL_570221 [Nephila pilipes]|uniref:Uncharacterized protein n=1 Tax=Nephila pilipes TaxID=299642 RepID=A0A8X6T8T5_NEPPI|nr:hypothetical protein NPIL_570221 [Nephila pilipes]